MILLHKLVSSPARDLIREAFDRVCTLLRAYAWPIEWGIEDRGVPAKLTVSAVMTGESILLDTPGPETAVLKLTLTFEGGAQPETGFSHAQYYLSGKPAHIPVPSMARTDAATAVILGPGTQFLPWDFAGTEISYVSERAAGRQGSGMIGSGRQFPATQAGISLPHNTWLLDLIRSLPQSHEPVTERGKILNALEHLLECLRDRILIFQKFSGETTSFLDAYFTDNKMKGSITPESLYDIAQAGLLFVAQRLCLPEEESREAERMTRLRMCCTQALQTGQLPYPYFHRILQELGRSPEAGDPHNSQLLAQYLHIAESLMESFGIAPLPDHQPLGVFRRMPGSATYILASAPGAANLVAAAGRFADGSLQGMLNTENIWDQLYDVGNRAINQFLEAHFVRQNNG